MKLINRTREGAGKVTAETNIRRPVIVYPGPDLYSGTNVATYMEIQITHNQPT